VTFPGPLYSNLDDPVLPLPSDVLRHHLQYPRRWGPPWQYLRYSAGLVWVGKTDDGRAELESCVFDEFLQFSFPEEMVVALERFGRC
jgi:hypothetical protein